MVKKLTITLSDEVYEALHDVIGPDYISQFIELLVRPRVIETGVDNGYRLLAEDEERESEALEWVEALTGDIADKAL